MSAVATKPISDYRCEHCKQGAWPVYARMDVVKAHRDLRPLRVQFVHVTHLIDCPIGQWKSLMGFPRIL